MDTTRSAQGTDKIRTIAWVRRLAIGGALAAALAVAGSGAGAQDADRGSMFDRNPGAVAGRNSVDPFDPFAPVGFTGSGAAVASKVGIPAAETSVARSEVDLPPMPGLPGESF